MMQKNKKIESYLTGGDLRSIAKVDELVPLVNNQTHFDQLFSFLFDDNRLVIMRAVDAIEKITYRYPSFLNSHKTALLNFLEQAREKEFKWHLSLLVARLQLSSNELKQLWTKLAEWAKDQEESKIVRVNAVQSLYNLIQEHEEMIPAFEQLVTDLRKENVPSINARLRKLLEL